MTRTKQKMSDFGEVKSRKKVRGKNNGRIVECALVLHTYVND